jgi:hypothetical protein
MVVNPTRTKNFLYKKKYPAALPRGFFITIIKREPFDYTKWRENLFKDVPLDEFLNNAAEARTAKKEPHP